MIERDNKPVANIGTYVGDGDIMAARAYIAYVQAELGCSDDMAQTVADFTVNEIDRFLELADDNPNDHRTLSLITGGSTKYV